MKSRAGVLRFAIVVMAALQLCGCRGDVDGHSDGEMQVTVRVEVRDAQTRRGLEGVRVTFFTRSDMYAMAFAAKMSELGREDVPAPPKGVSTETDLSGKAVAECWERAAFLFRGSVDNVVEKQWWPTGMFRFEKTGYEPMQKQLADFYPSPPYTGRKAPAPVVVELKRKV